MAMKKLVALALCLLLCALLSLPALAEVAAASKPLTNEVYMTSGDYTYTLLEDGGARIIDYTGDAEALTVPAELDGHLVRQIGDRAFSACFSLTSVTLPKGLTAIGEDAFQHCESLASIALPEGLTAIGDNAFFSCGLTSIALPDSLTSMGANPFLGCSSLTAIDISPDHPVFAQADGVLYEKASGTLVCYPAGKADSSFAVPEGTLSIGDDAFDGCFFLTSVALPDSLTSIGEGAFDGCSDTLTLTVPRDSYACQYAIDNGIPYTCSDANG